MVKRTSSAGTNNCKNIAITIGDVGGVGPEITVKSIYRLTQDNSLIDTNLFIIGNCSIIEKAVEIVNLPIKVKKINEFHECKNSFINVYEIPSPDKFSFNKTSKENGLFAFNSILKAIEFANKGKIKAIVTSPISKKGLKLAGIDFPGHTEILAKYTDTKDFRMLFVSKNFNVILHTIHIPLKEVPQKLSYNSLKTTINLGINFLKKFLKIEKPLIYVAGLNPHAGEDGLIGDEEKKVISPLISSFKKKGVNIHGPFPPDTIFFKAIYDKPDLIVALYHDQGLIPIKILDFYGAINVTCGIPFLRTSPDHGTAFDIAWKGIANPESMLNAIKFAIKYS